MKPRLENTNWYVITGGPSSGKSKLIDALAFEGFSTRPEAARIKIDEEMSNGKFLAEIRGDEQAFQLVVLQMKVKAEAAAKPKDLIFWERGVPDSITYLNFCKGDATPALQASQRMRYRKVFLLDRLPIYRRDYARTEDEVQTGKIHESLSADYTQLGYNVVRVPVLSISERVKFIVSHIQNDKQNKIALKDEL